MSYGYGGGNGYGNNNSFNGGGPPPQNYPPPQHYNNNYPPAPSHYSSHYGPPPPSLGGYSNSRGPYDDPYPPPMMPPHQQHYPDPHQQHSPFPPHPDEFRAPPEVALDPNAFRRFFAYHLTTLTYNSKPAITNLTLFAHQHLLRMSTVVASCLEDHLRTVSQPISLFLSFSSLPSTQDTRTHTRETITTQYTFDRNVTWLAKSGGIGGNDGRKQEQQKTF